MRPASRRCDCAAGLGAGAFHFGSQQRRQLCNGEAWRSWWLTCFACACVLLLSARQARPSSSATARLRRLLDHSFSISLLCFLASKQVPSRAASGRVHISQWKISPIFLLFFSLSRAGMSSEPLPPPAKLTRPAPALQTNERLRDQAVGLINSTDHAPKLALEEASCC